MQVSQSDRMELYAAVNRVANAKEAVDFAAAEDRQANQALSDMLSDPAQALDGPFRRCYRARLESEVAQVRWEDHLRELIDMMNALLIPKGTPSECPAS